MSDSSDVDSLLKRLSTLKGARLRHEQVWRQCFDFTFPLRSNGLGGDVTDVQTAQTKKSDMVDDTATDAALVLASSYVTGTTPASSRWIDLDAGDVSHETQAWLDDAATKIWTNIHASNFDSIQFECAVDMVAAGQFAKYIDVDRKKGGYTFEQWPLSEVYAASTRPDGVIDTTFREYQLTAITAVREFGADKVSEKTRDLAIDKPETLVDFLHVICPRDDHKPGARLSKNLPICSKKIEVKEKRIVSEKGYEEMPVVVPRWTLVPKSAYGVGPVFNALPNIKTLNQLVRTELAAVDLAVSGMWIAKDDGVLNPRTVKVGPRRIIVANDVDSMKPLLTGADFNVSFSEAAQLRAAIRKTLMADQLPPADGPAKTAYEYSVRVQQIRQILGPVYGRIQAEDLTPMVIRCFGLALRAGILGQIPDELENRSIAVKFLSPISRAQKLDDVNSINQLVTMAAPWAQVPGLQDVVDNIDGDESMRIAAHAMGAPTKALRPQKKVMALRQARVDEAEQAQQQQVDVQQEQDVNAAMADRLATTE
jgi:hypothetical protein